MKKVLFLFAMSFGLLSFTTTDGDKNKDKNKEDDSCTVCCTATVTYYGEYHSEYTSCVSGCGPESVNLACASARGQAQEFIDAQ